MKASELTPVQGERIVVQRGYGVKPNAILITRETPDLSRVLVGKRILGDVEKESKQDRYHRPTIDAIRNSAEAFGKMDFEYIADIGSALPLPEQEQANATEKRTQQGDG